MHAVDENPFQMVLLVADHFSLGSALALLVETGSVGTQFKSTRTAMS
jgi:hypothetical protein